MNDVKRFNRKFIAIMVMIFLVVGSAVFGMIAANLWIADSNVQYLVYVASIIFCLVAFGLLQGRMERIMQLGFLARIRAHAGDPLPMDHTLDMDKMDERLKCLGYQFHRRDPDHSLYFRVTKDNIRKTFPKYILEVIVLLNPGVKGFYIDSVDTEIGEIQQAHLKLSKRIDRMLITQIKDVDDLDEKTKDSIKEIIFVRTRYTLISTINVGLYRPRNMAVMLYSATYRPSLYYSRHLEEIRRIL